MAISMEFPKDQRPDATDEPWLREIYDHSYTAEQCGARLWNGGFGGQCCRSVDVSVDEIDPNLLDADLCRPTGKHTQSGEAILVDAEGFKGGLCNQHAKFLAKNGYINHGFFELAPPTSHPWKWQNAKLCEKNFCRDPSENVQLISEEKEVFQEMAKTFLEPVEETVVVPDQPAGLQRQASAPDTVSDSDSDSESDDEYDAEICPICQEYIGDEDYPLTHCGHKFCPDCIAKWVAVKSPNAKCPVCNDPRL